MYADDEAEAEMRLVELAGQDIVFLSATEVDDNETVSGSDDEYDNYP